MIREDAVLEWDWGVLAPALCLALLLTLILAEIEGMRP